MIDNSGDETTRALQNGRIEIEGLLPWSSNYAFLVRVCEDDIEIEAVYKPQRGERPLWDFPEGTLCYREQAAFTVSEALNWHIVPPTALREAHHGLGTVQLFIDHDPQHHYFTIEGDPAYRQQLQQIVLLDILINNADRKAGHVLLEKNTDQGAPARLWGIDHGICFHTEPKLRTVIWEFGGTPIPPDLQADLKALSERLGNAADGLRPTLQRYLAPAEIAALDRRLSLLLEPGIFPLPGSGRHYPWPPI